MRVEDPLSEVSFKLLLQQHLLGFRVIQGTCLGSSHVGVAKVSRDPGMWSKVKRACFKTGLVLAQRLKAVLTCKVSDVAKVVGRSKARRAIFKKKIDCSGSLLGRSTCALQPLLQLSWVVK